MSAPGLRPALKRATLLLSVLYPALIWLTHDIIHPGILGMAALLVLAGRWTTDGRDDGLLIALLPLPLIAGYAGWLMLSSDPRVSRLYPVLVNLMLLSTFAWTLWHPPSMAERLARAAGVAISAAGVGYRQVVTMIWCGYFLLNGALAAWLAWNASLEAWALYTGVVGYAIAGVILLIELRVRRWYRARIAQAAEQTGA